MATKVSNLVTPILIYLRLPHKLSWIIQFLQTPALGCVKLSFVYLFRRIFNVGGHSRWFTIITTSSIILLVIWTLGFMLEMFLQCPGHLTAQWSSSASRYCRNQRNVTLAYCFTNIATELLVIVLPIAPVRILTPLSLQMCILTNIALALEPPNGTKAQNRRRHRLLSRRHVIIPGNHIKHTER